MWKIKLKNPNQTKKLTTKKPTFKLKAEGLIILRNLKLMLVFRFHDLPWYSCCGTMVLVLLVMAKLSSFYLFWFLFSREKGCIFQSAKFLTLEDDEGATYAKCMRFTFQFNCVSEGGA